MTDKRQAKRGKKREDHQMLAPRRLGYYTNRERKRFPKIKVEVCCMKMIPGAVMIRVHEMSEFTLTLAELFVKSCEFPGLFYET